MPAGVAGPSGGTQVALPVDTVDTVALTVSTVSTRTWPTGLPAQVAALAEVLEACRTLRPIFAPMATFLTTTDTSASIERVIRNAKQELTLVSAYVYPRVIYLQRLKDAAARGVHITLIFGKRRMDEKVMKLFRAIDNLDIHYLHELHAKCFVNEEEAIITSLNLLNGSEEKNREMGVRLERRTDRQAYDDCVAEVRSILAVADHIHSAPQGPAPTPRRAARKKAQAVLPAQGHCIRCGVARPCNPDAPLCREDFLVWIRHENPRFREKHCHTCGKEHATSMADPLCNACWATYGPAIKALDEANGGTRPRWRAAR